MKPELTDKLKYSLMWMYMRPVLSVSGFVSICVFGFLLLTSADELVVAAVILSVIKLFVLALCTLLFCFMRSDSTRYFYINLGIPVKKLILLAVGLDLALFFACLVLIAVVRYGIG
jgi:hypothetical protein